VKEAAGKAADAGRHGIDKASEAVHNASKH
jgi:hypothetical protein